MQVTSKDHVFAAGDRAEFFADRHTCVFGWSRTGKSFLTKKELHGRLGTISIYFNSANESAAGRRIHTVKQLQVGIARGVSTFNFVPYQNRADPQRDAKRTRQLAQIVNLLFSIGERMRAGGDQVPTWCHLLVDEAHNYAPKNVSNPLQVVAVEGAKDGIRLVAITQRPAKVHHDVLTQSTHVYFRLNSYEGPYFRDYQIPVHEFRPWIDRPRHFVICEGDRWVAFRPV